MFFVAVVFVRARARARVCVCVCFGLFLPPISSFRPVITLVTERILLLDPLQLSGKKRSCEGKQPPKYEWRHRGGRCKCWFGDPNGVSSFSFFFLNLWYIFTVLYCTQYGRTLVHSQWGNGKVGDHGGVPSIWLQIWPTLGLGSRNG